MLLEFVHKDPVKFIKYVFIIYVLNIIIKNQILEIDRLIEIKEYNKAITIALNIQTENNLEDNENKLINSTILILKGYIELESQNYKTGIEYMIKARNELLEIKNNQKANSIARIIIRSYIEYSKQLEKEKKIIEAAIQLEHASALLKQIGDYFKSLEIRARAYMFRASGAKTPDIKHRYLLEAVELFERADSTNPVIMGYLEYYSALSYENKDINMAINSIKKSIQYFKQANRKDLANKSRKIFITLRKKRG